MVSVGAVPFTGGLSLFITTATAAATYGAYAQCAASVVRTGAEFVNPELNIDMDNSAVYQALATAADIIGLAGVAATGVGTLRAIQLMKKASSKPMLEIVKGLTSHERQRLAEEILRSKHPGLSRSALSALWKTPDIAKRYAQKPISAGLRKQLFEVLGAMGNVTGSATGGVISQVASGSVDQNYIVGLVRAYQTQ